MGPESIEGHYDEAISVVGLLEEVRKGEMEGCDGYVIACFGDPGLLAAREIAGGPVIGIAEAAMHYASMISTGFSVVTTLERTCVIADISWTPMAWSVSAATSAGPTWRCSSWKTLIQCVSDHPRRVPTRARRRSARAQSCWVARAWPTCADIVHAIGVPVVDGVAAAVKMVESLVTLGLRTSKRGDLACPLPKAYSGLVRSFAP